MDKIWIVLLDSNNLEVALERQPIGHALYRTIDPFNVDGIGYDTIEIIEDAVGGRAFIYDLQANRRLLPLGRTILKMPHNS